MEILGWEVLNEWAVLDEEQVRNEIASVNKTEFNLGKRDILMHGIICMDGYIHNINGFNHYNRLYKLYVRIISPSEHKLARKCPSNSVLSCITFASIH